MLYDITLFLPLSLWTAKQKKHFGKNVGGRAEKRFSSPLSLELHFISFAALFFQHPSKLQVTDECKMRLLYSIYSMTENIKQCILVPKQKVARHPLNLQNLPEMLK